MLLSQITSIPFPGKKLVRSDLGRETRQRRTRLGTSFVSRISLSPSLTSSSSTLRLDGISLFERHVTRSNVGLSLPLDRPSLAASSSSSRLPLSFDSLDPTSPVPCSRTWSFFQRRRTIRTNRSRTRTNLDSVILSSRTTRFASPTQPDYSPRFSIPTTTDSTSYSSTEC